MNAEKSGKGDDAVNEAKTRKKQAWGPIVAQGRSQRHLRDGRTILEKAQEARRKWNEEVNKGKTSSSGMHISSCDLKIVVDAIGIVNLDGNPISANLTRRLENDEEERNSKFSSKFKSHMCNSNPDNTSNQGGNRGQGFVSVETELSTNAHQQGAEVEVQDGRNRRATRNRKMVEK
jgi:hypothetical protein